MRMKGVVLVALLVFVASGCGGEEVAVTSPPGGGAVTTTVGGPSTSAAAAPASTTSTNAATGDEPGTAPPSTTATGLASPGNAISAPTDGWIAVLASLPSGEYDEAGALQRAGAASDELAEHGSEVAVLLSDRYPTLNPGFWVLYLGTADRQAEAESLCAAVRAAVPDCYTRNLAGDIADRPVGHDEGLALAVLESGPMAVIDTTTGQLVRTIQDAAYGNGSYPAKPVLSADGRSAYYSVGSEDFWFSCESSDGTLVQLDLRTGADDKIGDGFSPAVTPDGSTLIYLASSTCIPDPNEASWVLAPIDTVVRRSLATGEESRITLPLSGEIAEGYEFWSLALLPGDDVAVVDTAGTVWRVTAAGEVSALTRLDPGSLWWLIGYSTVDGAILALTDVWDHDSASTQTVTIDPETGELGEVTVYEDGAAVALDVSGNYLLVATAGMLRSDAGAAEVGFGIIDLAW